MCLSPVIEIGQPTYEKVTEELFLDKPLHVILNKSKLAYRIYVILIANKGFKKNKSRNNGLCLRGNLQARDSAVSASRIFSMYCPFTAIRLEVQVFSKSALQLRKQI
jgi:hypothetical protein